MSFPESEISRFHIVEDYELNLADSSRDPLVVISKTNQALGLRVNEALISTDPIDQYLEQYTIPFIEEARSVAVAKSASGLIDPSGMNLVTALEKGADDVDAVRKQIAYDLSSMIVGMIPDFLEQSLPKGTSVIRSISTAQAFPVTEVKKQLDEVHRVISLTLSGAYDSTKLKGKSPSLIRTQAFFIVGAAVPRFSRNLQYEEKSQKEENQGRIFDRIKEQARKERGERKVEADGKRLLENKQFTQLLEGIDIDL